MPLAKPHKHEGKSDFIHRCMGDKIMKGEFPDKDQRLAVCYDQWREKTGEKRQEEFVRTTNKQLLVLCGPSHAGKSTYAQRLSKQFTIINAGRVRKALVDSGKFAEDDDAVWDSVWAEVSSRKQTAAKASQNIILDACHLTPEARYCALEGIDVSYRKTCVVFDVPFSAIRERCLREKRIDLATAKESWEKFNRQKPTRDGLLQEGFNEVRFEGNEPMKKQRGAQATLEFRSGFPFEVRAEKPEDGVGVLEGHAAIFNSETVIGGEYREVVRPGAFKKTIQEGDPVMLWCHDRSQPLGRKSAGTLEIAEDDKGVHVRANLPDTTYGHNARVSVGRGDVKHMSFSFRRIKQNWVIEPGQLPLRELLELQVPEVSPETLAQYTSTDISAVEARSIMEASGINPDATTEEPVEADHSPPEPVEADHSTAGAEELSRLQREQRKCDVALELQDTESPR